MICLSGPFISGVVWGGSGIFSESCDFCSFLSNDISVLTNDDDGNPLNESSFNLIHQGDTILKNKTKPFKIISFDSLRVGILGIGIQLAGLVEKRLYKQTKYPNNQINNQTNQQTDTCRNQQYESTSKQKQMK